MSAFRFLAIFVLLQIPGMAQETHTYIAQYSYPASGPQVYKDPKSGTLLYFESDGRHVAAISPDGKLLWNRDPFSNLPLYRFDSPKVAGIRAVPAKAKVDGVEPDKFVEVFLANSQFGWLRISDGEFRFGGQD